MTLMDHLLNYFSSAPQPVRTGPGQSYGPAVSRITRTPINFTDQMSAAKNAGEYDPSTKAITVNPRIDDPGETVRHESIHALLDRVPQSSAIAGSSSGYPEIQQVLSRVGGDPRHEVPAYLGSAAGSQFVGLTDQMRQQFLDDFTRRLRLANSGASAQFQRVMDSSAK